jgi:hypothetical protein
MTKVGIASGAMHFIAHHAKTGIGRFLYMVFYKRVVTRPAGTAFEFSLAVKQFKSATDTSIDRKSVV